MTYRLCAVGHELHPTQTRTHTMEHDRLREDIPHPFNGARDAQTLADAVDTLTTSARRPIPDTQHNTIQQKPHFLNATN